MRTIILLILLLLLAGFLRFYHLDTIPPGLHGDEAEWGLIEQKINRGEYESFFSLGKTGQFFDFSVLSYFVQGLFLRVFGDTIFAIRSSSAFAATLTVIAFYFLASRFFKHRLTVVLTTLALATSHWHIAYSRLAILNIWTPLFLVVLFALFLKALDTKKTIYFVLSGVVLGLSLYFHHTVKAIPIILGLFSIFYCIEHRKQHVKRLFVHLSLVIIIAVIVFSPQAWYYITHPDTFSPRLNEVSIFNHLPTYFDRYEVSSIPEVLFWQFINTIKVFHFGGDIGYLFYGYQGGLLAPIVASLALVGLLIAFATFKSDRSQLLIVWFFSIIIFGGVLTVDPPSSQRLVGVIPVLFLFAGLTIERLLSYKKAVFLLAVLFLINAVWDYHIYFNNYIRSQAGWAQREPATQIAYYLQALGPGWKVYMLRENTWLYFKHGTIRFINPQLEGIDVEDSSTVIPLKESAEKNIVFIMPPFSPSLKKLQRVYPDGKTLRFYNPIGNTPSFVSYEISRRSFLKSVLQ